MKKKWYKSLFIVLGLYMSPQFTFGQQAQGQVITIQRLFELIKENHPGLKVSRSDINIAKQNIEVAKNQLLPEISMGVQAFYLGDAYLIDRDFSNSTKVEMPHFGNKFAVDVRQLIWKGGAVRNGIKVQSLREELSQLNYEVNEQSIKLLVLSYYLDLQKLYNQESVYSKNIELAEQRLQNINRFYNQGMVTRNDVIRGELQLSNLKLSLQVVKNNQQILNKQLTVALGLDESVTIIPDGSPDDRLIPISGLEHYRKMVKEHPSFQLAQKAIDITDLSVKITKAELRPTFSAFAGNSLQRPITTTSPARDMYSNGWSAGLSLNWNIDAFFKVPKKLKVNHYENEKAVNQSNEVEQMLEVAVKAAYIKYNEAITQNSTLEVNKNLAGENYRIMESKYNNQLAILIDLIDASNAKLDAELQFANSQINITYAYYKLLKEAGSLS